MSTNGSDIDRDYVRDDVRDGVYPRRTPVSLVVLLALTAVVFVPLSVFSQEGQPARRVISGGTLPSTCTSSILVKDFFHKTGAASGLYVCSAANTWTQLTASSAPMPVSGGNFTGQVNFTNGTASEPAWGWASDDDTSGTGMFRPSANSIAFTMNGTQLITMTSSGSIVIPAGQSFSFGAVNSLSYTAGTGPLWDDGGSGFTAQHDLTALGAARTYYWPNADTRIPVSSQTLTFAGPTAARTVTLPDADITVARTDAANTFTGTQSISTASLSVNSYALGTWTTPAFNAGDYTGNGSMTVTAESGDVTTMHYTIIDKTMIVSFALASLTVGGTPSTQIRFLIPASKTAAKAEFSTIVYNDNGGADANGYVRTTAGGTLLLFIKNGAGNWTASTDNTYLSGQITFEIQ